MGSTLAYTNSIKSIAIGSFDGIHVAHRALIERVEAVVIIERNGGYLTPGYKRTLLIEKVCCFYHFDVIKGLSPENFIQKIQRDFPKLEKIVVGYDFTFGKDKAGDTEGLADLFSGCVEIVKEVSIEGISVHSRTIKAFLKEGSICMANRLLGRNYTLEGEVISGQGLGKKSLVPTLNLKVESYQLPQEGVYVTRTLVDEVWMLSVSFLGHRSTTDGSFAVETHVLEHDIGKVMGKVNVEFIDFIRMNQKFQSLKVLREQIENDIALAKER